MERRVHITITGVGVNCVDKRLESIGRNNTQKERKGEPMEWLQPPDRKERGMVETNTDKGIPMERPKSRKGPRVKLDYSWLNGLYELVNAPMENRRFGPYPKSMSTTVSRISRGEWGRIPLEAPRPPKEAVGRWDLTTTKMDAPAGMIHVHAMFVPNGEGEPQAVEEDDDPIMDEPEPVIEFSTQTSRAKRAYLTLCAMLLVEEACKDPNSLDSNLDALNKQRRRSGLHSSYGLTPDQMFDEAVNIIARLSDA